MEFEKVYLLFSSSGMRKDLCELLGFLCLKIKKGNCNRNLRTCGLKGTGCRAFLSGATV